MKQIFVACFCFLVVRSVTLAQEEWMPDANLRQAVQEALELPAEIPLTQAEMPRLTGLEAVDSQITDLTGLEHAINLTWLNLGFTIRSAGSCNRCLLRSPTRQPVCFLKI